MVNDCKVGLVSSIVLFYFLLSLLTRPPSDLKYYLTINIGGDKPSVSGG